MNRNVCTTSNVIGTGATIAVAIFKSELKNYFELRTHTSLQVNIVAFYLLVYQELNIIFARRVFQSLLKRKLEVFNALDFLRTNFRNLSS